MSAITTRYTEDERQAMGAAAAAGMKAQEVIDRAAAGQLEHDGTPLPPFEITSTSTVRDAKARYLRRRAGLERSELASAPPKDAIENLRQRLINAADAMLEEEERKRPKDRDPERLRQIIRCVREAAAIPGRDDPRPVAPGQRDEDGQHNGGKTRGGLAAQIIESANRLSDDVAPFEPAPPPEPVREPAPEPSADPGQEIAAIVRRRLEPVVAPEPVAPGAAPARQPHDTLPTAMSGAVQLEEAREKFGWDPLRSPEPPQRRSRRATFEDLRSVDEFYRGS